MNGGDGDAAVLKMAAFRRPLSRRGFLLRGVGAARFSGFSTAVYAAAIEPERLITTSYRISPPGWNAGRLTVAAIADVHAGGPNMAVEHIARVVDATNALRPDLVVLLGDYIATHEFVTERVPPESLGSRIHPPGSPARSVGDSRQSRLVVRCRRGARRVRASRYSLPRKPRSFAGRG
jgi:hypothetical protein